MRIQNQDIFIDAYRYGFNGAEKDDEISGNGNVFDLGLREYDTRLGRMFSIDPRTPEYPCQSPYVYHRNSPISRVDYRGGGDPQIAYPFSLSNPFSPLMYNFGRLWNGVMNTLTFSFEDYEEQKLTKPITGISSRVTVRKQGFGFYSNFSLLGYYGGNNTIVYPSGGLFEYKRIDSEDKYIETKLTTKFRLNRMPVNASFSNKLFDDGTSTNTGTVTVGPSMLNASFVTGTTREGGNINAMKLNLVIPKQEIKFPDGTTMESNLKTVITFG